jgi:acylphosphatase
MVGFLWSNGKMTTMHILVSGIVQGVGYRAFCQRVAEKLKICGWARNLADGRVEVLAVGDAKQMDELQKELLKGPRASKVLALEAKEIAGARQIERFSIVEDGVQPWSDG